jgi:transcriptional regulator with XRE-family HTH domain
MTSQQQLAFPESQEMRSVLGCPFPEYGSTRRSESSSPVPIVWHEEPIPYAQTMDKRASFGFGARLKQARLESKMTGAELGKGVGEKMGKDASKQSVADWEAERHYPKADQLRLICLKLNVSSDSLIFGDIKKDTELEKAASVVQALTEEQRKKLLAMMLGPAIPDQQVAKHLPPSPKQSIDKKEKSK